MNGEMRRPWPSISFHLHGGSFHELSGVAVFRGLCPEMPLEACRKKTWSQGSRWGDEPKKRVFGGDMGFLDHERAARGGNACGVGSLVWQPGLSWGSSPRMEAVRGFSGSVLFLRRGVPL